MPTSEAQITQDMLTTLKTEVGPPLAGLDVTSTTTTAYKVFNPFAAAAAVVAREGRRLRLAMSFLGSEQQHLDNRLREINSPRVREETDESARRNAPLIFNPNSVISTIVDREGIQDENQQLTDIRIRTREYLYDLMKTRFHRLTGKYMDLPALFAFYWSVGAQRLNWISAFQRETHRGMEPEEAEDIRNTEWIYRFDALRIPGSLDAQVRIVGYNRLELVVRTDERPSTDARGRREVRQRSEVLQGVRGQAAHHLPELDDVVLKVPVLDVHPPRARSVAVVGNYTGVATILSVQQAIEDYFYTNRRIGQPLSPTALIAAVEAVTGVTSFVISSPTVRQLTPSTYEIIDLAHIKIRNT